MVPPSWRLRAAVCCIVAPWLFCSVLATVEQQAAENDVYVESYTASFAEDPDGVDRLDLELQPELFNSDGSVSFAPIAMNHLINPSRRLMEPGCAYISKQINKFSNQGFSVDIKRFKNPSKCPQRCKSGYKGPATGKGKMYCSPQNCYCTISQGSKGFKNIVIKDSGALSVVDALPPGCPKADCIGGGFKLCQKC